MTSDRATSNSPRRRPEAAAPFAVRPLAARSLAHALVERLSAEIVSGRLAPGAQLPTEQELIATCGVSRTVVREAIAALRAEGLVVTRQGAGAFVAEGSRRPFRIDPVDLGSLGEVLAVMELRTGIEVEAAGLAAERAKAADLRDIAAAYEAVGRAIERGEAAIDQDFAFHRSIASATGNAQFGRFLEYLGRFIIPRQTIHVADDAAERTAYLRTIHKEHLAILKAIRAKSVAAARTAMRDHLSNSRKRYQTLAAVRDDR
jgi:GntR family transcriptional regulator, transcriptional repressor for pyruvate dehydrogenase complex